MIIATDVMVNYRPRCQQAQQRCAEIANFVSFSHTEETSRTVSKVCEQGVLNVLFAAALGNNW